MSAALAVAAVFYAAAAAASFVAALLARSYADPRLVLGRALIALAWPVALLAPVATVREDGHN